MPFDLAAARSASAPTLREAALELMLRAQCGPGPDPGLDEPALRAELRRLAVAARPPAGGLWAAYSGERSATRRRCHAALTLG